jgi:uncharacterized protein YegL
MPKFMDKNAEQTHQTLHGFQFSAVKIENLGASEYTIVTIVQDISGSVQGFASDMEATLQKILEACIVSPRSENLLIRLVTFNDDVEEVHGFRELKTISPAEYTGILKCYGSTALMDAALNSAEATENYGKQLSALDYRSNAVMFVITDGQDNVSVVAKNPEVLKKAFKKIKTGEIALESFLTVLIGVGDDKSIIDSIKQLSTDAGFDQFVEMGSATPSKLAKLADFISRSISSVSQNLNDRQPSQPLTF